MNKLNGHIREIETHGNLSKVIVNLNEQLTLSSLVIDTPQTAGYLQIGHPVTLLFKETEVILSPLSHPEVSIQNQIPCTIKGIENGKLLSKVMLGSEFGLLESIIPYETVMKMRLDKGQEVTVLVKFNEIMLAGQ